MADVKKTKVTFKVTTCETHDALYVCGNVAELGEWNPAKSVKLEYNSEEHCYECAKMLPVGTCVEYKVLASKDWANVECAADGFETPNHSFEAVKGHVEEISVPCFR